ncbi:MAG: 2Fe-2S iron-sulfur cluster-binding protein [Burkholderiaceae bacterium]|nr:2Fe-2S iron-sulfur cluster-binding protein [Burkholderiaceae bacterium]
MHRLRIEPGGWEVDAPADRSLLQAARDAGLRLPRSCQNGTCRACRCRLRWGAVIYRVEWPGLSAEERASGEVLPCVALPRSDVCLEAPEARPVGRPAG